MAASTVTSSPIGYYVHNHGTGHMRRALTICRQISRPVILFSSAPQPADLPANVNFVQLVSDAVAGYVQPSGSVFHYTPYATVIFERNRQLIDAWRSYDIRELYVDVSIEIAVLAKLYGMTVGYALMQGDRTDQAHRYGYDAADYLLAHCAPQFDDLTGHVTSTPILYSGGISRFKKHQPTPLSVAQLTIDGHMPRSIIVTTSPKHEDSIEDAILASAKQFPATTWHIVGQNIAGGPSNIVSHGVVVNPESLYADADIIVGSGGMNTIMEAASLGKPFVCIPEARPFDEQIAAAKALQRLNAAVYLPTFPEPADWPAVIDELQIIDLTVFTDLVSDGAAKRAARIIENTGKL